MNYFNKYSGRIVLILAVLTLQACATVETETESDPYESFNRTMHGFNKGLDTAILKPVAQGYDAVAPDPVKIGVSNFFANIDDVPTSVNQFLQGKFSDGFSDIGRFVINTTLGVAGFFDVASQLGLESHDEDFGQTLGAWGIESGPYVVWPLLGPSTLRDSFARPVDSATSIPSEIDHIRTRNKIYFMDLVDLRYRLLSLDSQLEDALDEYSFVRDAFLMRREYQVYDGNPPEDDDLYDDDCLEDEDYCDDEIID